MADNKDMKGMKISRRTVLQAGLFVLAAGATGGALAETKIAQNLVQYQNEPKGTQECDQCMHFVPPDACKVVAGKISPTGWCAAFAPKPK